MNFVKSLGFFSKFDENIYQMMAVDHDTLHELLQPRSASHMQSLTPQGLHPAEIRPQILGPGGSCPFDNGRYPEGFLDQLGSYEQLVDIQRLYGLVWLMGYPPVPPNPLETLTSPSSEPSKLVIGGRFPPRIWPPGRPPLPLRGMPGGQ